MALSRIKTWVSEVLTSSDLNAEFNNILNNAISLISPLTGNLAAGGNDVTGVDELAFDNATTDASATGRLRRNGLALTWHDGTAARYIPMVLDRDVSTNTINNSAAETTVYSFSVPGNTLYVGTTSRTLRTRLYGTFVNTTGAPHNITFKTKYGATTASTIAFTSLDSDANTRNWYADIEINANAASNSQRHAAMIYITAASGAGLATDASPNPAFSLGVIPASSAITEDSSVAQTLAITIQLDAADANLTARCENVITSID